MKCRKKQKKNYSVLRDPNREQDNDTIWGFRIKIAIWYFDIIVRQAIAQNINDHMEMFYYYHFVKAIIANMPDLPFAKSDLNRNSRNFDLIESIFSKMMDWEKVILESKNDKLSKSVYDCIGQCIYELSITDKLNEKDKHYLISWVWEDLIGTFPSEDNMVEKIINIGFEMFKKPSRSFLPECNYGKNENRYLSVLKTLWDKRDTPKLDENILMGERANKFKEIVIDNFNVKNSIERR